MIRTCHGLVNNNAGESLYFHAQHLLAAHFERIRQRDLVQQQGIAFILEVGKLWQDSQLVGTMVKDILLYLVHPLFFFFFYGNASSSLISGERC